MPDTLTITNEPRPRPWYYVSTPWLHAALIAVLFATALIAAFAPLGTTCEIPVCGDGPCGPEVCSGASTVENDGWRPILILFGLPLLLALSGAVVRNSRVAVATVGVTFILMLLGAASLGFLLLPALVIAVLLAVRVSIAAHQRVRPTGSD